MRKVVYVGFGISMLGAALDFAGYSLNLLAPDASMRSAPTSAAIALYLLGIGVLTIGALMVLPRMAWALARLGLVMEALGVVMVLAGGWMPGMNAVLSYAMTVVGGAMILDGALMQRGKASMGRD